MLNNLPDASRVWIFQADRLLTAVEVELCQKTLAGFIPFWAAHGAELYGDFEVAHNLFLVIGVDESKAPPSGCSIDKMTKAVQELGKNLQVDFLNRLNTAFDDCSSIRLVGQAEFRQLIREGKIGAQTIVFNNLVQTKGELENKWKTAVENSWHKALLLTV